MTIWRGIKVSIGLALSLPFAALGCVGWLLDHGCDAVIRMLARWAKR